MSYFFNYVPEDGLKVRGRWPKPRDADGGGDNFIETVLAKGPDAGPKKRHRGRDRRPGVQQAPVTPSAIRLERRADGRPASPESHMRTLRLQVMQPREVEDVGEEVHRHTWFPRSYIEAPLGKTRLPQTKGPDAKATLGTGPKTYGLLRTDYGVMTQQYEQGLEWKRHQKRTGTEPPPLVRLRENPSIMSRGTNSCWTSGTNISLKHQVDPSLLREEKRQVGLYEDSFNNFKGYYKSPVYGLSSSDVTKLGEEIAKQQSLIRK